MTVTVLGDQDRLEQIIQQTNRLVDVIQCTDHTGDDAVVREMALVKVLVSVDDRTELLQVAEHFGSKSVDFTPTSIILMVTGDSAKVDACVKMLGQYRVVELIRTGKVVMARGAEET